MISTRSDAIERLKSFLYDGDRVYASVISVSNNGMSRNMKFFKIASNHLLDLTGYIIFLKVAGAKKGRGQYNDCALVEGSGMDMKLHVVYCLSRIMDIKLEKWDL